MVSLDKRVKVQVWAKDGYGEWIIKEFSAEKNDSDISRILGEVFKLDIPVSSPIYVIQPNWAGTGEDVNLVEYHPFESIYTNTTHVRKTGKKG